MECGLGLTADDVAVRPRLLATTVGGGRLPKEVTGQSGVRDRHQAGVSRMWDLLMAYLGRSFEYAAKVVCRKTEESQTGLIHAKGAPFLGALNRTGNNEFAYQVRVFRIP